MGAHCSCLKSEVIEDRQMNFDSLAGLEISKSMPEKIKSSEDAKHPQVDIGDLVKLQSVIRGYLNRKITKQIYASPKNDQIEITRSAQRDTSESKPFVTAGMQNDVINIRTEIKFISENSVPDYSNTETRAIQSRLGNFEQQAQTLDPTITTKHGPAEIENGAIYTGE